MALDIIPKQEGGKLKAVASGTLPSGQPVVVNSDGTVSVIAESTVNIPSLATGYNYGGTPLYNAAVYDSNSSKVVIAYEDRDSGTEGTAIVGTVSGEVITFGTPVSFSSGGVRDVGATFDSTNNKVIICYNDTDNSQYGTAVVGTVSGTSISFGTNLVYESNTTYGNKPAYDSNSNDVVIAYRANIASNQGKCAVCSVSGTSLSRSDTVTFTNDLAVDMAIGFDSNLNKFLIVYKDEDNSDYGTARVGTISGGTTLSLGTPVVFNTAESLTFSLSFDTTANKFLLIYRDAGDNLYGKARVATISGSSVSFGTEVTFFSDRVDSLTSSYDPVENKTLVIVGSSTASPASVIVAATISGTSVSFGTIGDLEDLFSGGNAHLGSVYDSNAGKIVFCGLNPQSNGVAAVGKFTSTGTNLTSENYIGMSGGVVNSTPEELGTAVVFEAASTSFMGTAYDSSAGKVVIAYRDEGNSNYGTAIVGTVSGTGISFGSPVVFNTGNTIVYENGVTFDSSSNKIVITYSDNGNSGYGTAIVGTVSGTSISFGTEAVFESAGVGKPSAVFDSNNNKVVVVYDDGGNFDYGTAVVGTVSGTSISFGTPVVFASAAVDTPAAAYDTASQKTVVAYRDRDASDHGKALVGTVSGTSISFGSVVTFNSTSTLNLSMDYDSSAEKVVIGFGSPAESIGTAIVGTVSGTSISFGSATAFDEVGATNDISVTYNPTANRTVFFYKDGNNSNYGTYNVGTVSGTAISFGGEVVFEAATSEDMTSTYDAASGNVVVAYRDKGNSNYGTAKALQVGSTTRAEVADGDNAVVDIVGTVSTNQSGLTAGQQYYVQTDGTIGETPADPSVLAGTAVSATKLLVKT